MGEITNIKVPRVREIMYKSNILERYQRRSIKYTYDIMQIYLTRSSVRGIKKIVKRLFNNNISETTISNILKKAKEKLDKWREEKIEKEYEGLIVDGLYFNVKTIAKVLNKQKINKIRGKNSNTKGVILIVMGITKELEKEVIGFKVTYSESHDNWLSLLTNLIERGLKVKKEGIIVHDGAKGLISALEYAFPYNKKQLCLFHFIKDIGKYARNKMEEKEIKKELSEIHKSKNYKEAIRKYKELIKKWEKINPRIARYLSEGYEATLTYYEVEEEKRKYFSTTNYLEREFKEINRKIYDIGIFPNVYSTERIIFLLLIEHNLIKNTGVPLYA